MSATQWRSSYVELAGHASTHFPFVDLIFGHFLSVIVWPQRAVGTGERGQELPPQAHATFPLPRFLWWHNDREKMTEDDINKREMSACTSSQFYKWASSLSCWHSFEILPRFGTSDNPVLTKEEYQARPSKLSDLSTALDPRNPAALPRKQLLVCVASCCAAVCVWCWFYRQWLRAAVHRIWNTCEVVTFESLKKCAILKQTLLYQKNRLVIIPGPRVVDLRWQVVQGGKKKSWFISYSFVTFST